MAAQKHASQTSDSNEKLQHFFIPACGLGPELLETFSAENPNCCLQSNVLPPTEGDKHGSFCPSCLLCSKASASLGSVPPSLRIKPFIGDAEVVSANQRTATIMDSTVNRKPSDTFFANVRPPNPKQQQIVKARNFPFCASGDAVGCEHTVLKDLQLIMKQPECTVQNDLQRTLKQPQMLESATQQQSSQELIPIHELKTALPSKEASALEAAMPSSPTKTFHMIKPDNRNAANIQTRPSRSHITNNTLKFDDVISAHDQAMFDYIVATRTIPQGYRLATLDLRMRKKLLCHFKSYSPPCPHCLCNTFVKFRYFNNSTKSTLLQPRYACRNPDTCLIVQEHTGKVISRDFTLPKIHNAVNYIVFMRGLQQQANPQRKMLRLPQTISRIGGKRRPAHDQNLATEAFERNAKLPNATLSLKSTDGTGTVVVPSPVDLLSLNIPGVPINKNLRIDTVKMRKF